MAIPPHPQTLQGKIWRLIETWYDIIPRDVDEPAGQMSEGDQNIEGTADWRSEDTLEHWNLFSEERKQELIEDVGEDAPSIIEAHWGGREVKGIRILQYKVNAGGMSGWARVLVGYPDGTSEIEYFELVREADGWKVRDFASGDEVPEPQTE